MKRFTSHLTILASAMLALAGFSGTAAAEPLFFDDFEDRVRDQPLIGPGWTWYNQTYSDSSCTEYSSGFGPFDDGDGSDYLQENRNYWTASADQGQGDSYFRAGLEVPAWANDDGEKVVLSNMLRVYGDQYYNPDETTCKRTLVFQEMTVESAGSFSMLFDMAQDRFGAPAFGEKTGAFVKVLKSSDGSYNEILFEQVETKPPVSSTPENANTSRDGVDFIITEDMIGELMQFGFYTDITVDLGQGWGTSAVLYDNVTLTTLDIGPAHSGSFYNSGQSGHGFSIEFGYLPDGTPFGIVYWYTYDDEGNPIFMLGNGAVNGQTLEAQMFSPTGMQYGVWQRPTENPGGTAVFNFIDRDNATFTYTPSTFTETEWGHTTPITDLPLTKLFGIPADKYFMTTE
jgi:hypothetical protein